MTDSATEKTELQVVSAPTIEKRIFVVRERQVMLDEDLADLYCVETRVLVQQVKRNEKRFPAHLRRVASSYDAIEKRLEGIGRKTTLVVRAANLDLALGPIGL